MSHNFASFLFKCFQKEFSNNNNNTCPKRVSTTPRRCLTSNQLLVQTHRLTGIHCRREIHWCHLLGIHRCTRRRLPRRKWNCPVVGWVFLINNFFWSAKKFRWMFDWAHFRVDIFGSQPICQKWLKVILSRSGAGCRTRKIRNLMFRSAKDQWICTWGEKKSLVDFFCDLRRHQGVAYAILNDWLRDMPGSIDFDKTWDAWYYAVVMIERHLKSGKFYFVRGFLDQVGSKDGSEGFCWEYFWCKFFSYQGLAGWLSTMKYLETYFHLSTNG